MNRKIPSFILAVLLCPPALAFAATPTITSVSGTMQTGQTLTITGTNMMNEDMTNWTSFFTTNSAAAYYHTGSVVSGGFIDDYNIDPPGSGYASDQKLISPTRCLKSTWSGASDGNNKLGGAWIDFIPPVGGSGDIWTRAYIRTHTVGGWPTQEQKLWWFGNSPQPSFLNFDYTGTGSPPPALKILSGNVNGGSFISAKNFSDGPWQDDRWYLVEVKLRAASSAGTNEIWVNNQQLLSYATPGSNGYNSGFGWELITNAWGTNSNYVQNFWHDGLTQSTSRPGPASLIEIGNNATYASATKVYQYPVALSETSSQITANLTGLGAGPYYYLWVTNNRGERSATYNLSGGGVTSAPPAPGNLTLQ